MIAASESGEHGDLQDYINNLIRLQATPEIHNGQDSSQIVNTLLNLLVNLLSLDFAYARVSDVITGQAAEFVSLSHVRNPPLEAQEIGRALGQWLTNKSANLAQTIPNLAGECEVRIAPFNLGPRDELGMLVAGSKRKDFPTPKEVLLLRVGADQALSGLQGVRRRNDITEQKRAANALRISEEHFRHYFELGLIGMAITSPTKGILEVNDEFCRMLGYERKELLQKTWAEMTHPEDLAADVAAFNRVMAGECDGYSLDKRWIRKDGRIIESIMAAKCQRCPDRSVDYFVGLVLDTTARRHTEKELRRSEQYLAEGQRISHTGSWGWTVDSGEVIWSRETYRIFGVNPSEEVPSYNFAMQRVHAADRERVEKEVQRAAREWNDFRIEFRIQLADGTIKHLEAMGHPVHNGKTRSGEFIGVVMDVTERKQAEEKIRESEHRFRLLVESIPHHVWSFPTDWSVGYCNQRLMDYTGLTPEELRQGGWEALHPDDVERAKKAWQTAMTEGTEFQMEQRIRGRDDNYRRFFCRGIVVKDEHGRPMEWFGTNTDIEDHRRAEEALHKLQEELARLSRIATMGEMAASIAHEINQPLGAIVNNSNVCLRLMADRPPQDTSLHEALKDIVKDANRASAILSRIRNMIKCSPPERTLLQFNDILADVLALAQRELAERRIRIRIELPGGLPAIYGDRIELQQVLLNLVMNASEAMRAEPDERRVLTFGGRRGDLEGQPAVMITVRDLGEGFNPADAERLFDAFFTSKAHGMGLGLRISRSIIEQHGGRLWATVNEEGGATFVCVLPAET